MVVGGEDVSRATEWSWFQIRDASRFMHMTSTYFPQDKESERKAESRMRRASKAFYSFYRAFVRETSRKNVQVNHDASPPVREDMAA